VRLSPENPPDPQGSSLSPGSSGGFSGNKHKLKQNQSMDDQKKNEMMNAYYSEENKLLREERKHLGLSDFQIIKTIGVG